MRDYDFTLKFAITDIEMDRLVERLGEAGCDDALIGTGQQGRVALNFTRTASSAYEAVSSAVSEIRKAIPGAKLIEASPDFVGLTDMADIIGFSRQNMRKLTVSHASTFPAPVHEGNPAIWHLAKVLDWFREKRDCTVDEGLVEVAKANMQFNLAREMRDLEPSLHKDVLALIA